MRKIKSESGSRGLRTRIGIATGAAAATALALTAAPAYAAAGTLSLSSIYGPTAGGNTITATLSPGSSPNPTAFTSSTNAQFVAMATTSTACPAIYTAPGTNLGATVRYLSGTKVAVTVPTGVVLASGAASTNYKLCTYNGTTIGTGGSALVGQTTYTVGTPPTIVSVSPSFGPSLGNTTITVTGTNFTSTNLTATLDNEPLGDVTYIDSSHFSAKTPAHAPGGPYTVAVTTPGGMVNTLGSGARADLFTYSNGVVTAPNTAPMSTTPVDVDLQGVGFSVLDFTATTGAHPGQNKAHVYLVRGDYDPTLTATATLKTNGPVDECTGVIVISDKELLCSLDLSAGVRQTRTVKDAVTNTDTSLVSATASFAAGDVGKSVVGTGVAAGTTVLTYTNPTTVVLSAPTTATATGVTVSIGTSKTLTAVGVANSGSTAITGGGTGYVATTGTQCVTGTGIPLGTTLGTITSSGAAAVLSKAATASGTGLTISIVDCPVANDTYTLTVVSNGLFDVQTGGTNVDTTYKEAVISSGSTFTVSDF
ncbi:IPT/TIG domain-containing protein [Actinoplanes sp. NPDC051513]|uniref:IPT/TIG domain-containing protein n=1 Tax=Actinoplanes sp. NPDC051513 TaxID=3363908 RepID=UPI0037A90AA8